jgi:CDP-diglyceride synthetase
VDHGPDREDDEQDDRVPPARPEPSGPSTGGVRIIGAETAAEITSELPVVPPAHITPDPSAHSSVRIIEDVPDESGPTEPDTTHAELPHWTEPATGQVPAVLARDDDGPSDGILPPTWREEDADWVAHEEEFDPAMFSDERTSLGALDETGGADEVIRPWEFDLDSVQPGQPGPGASSGEPITEPVPVVPSDPESSATLARDDTPAPVDEPSFTGEATAVVPAVGASHSRLESSVPGDPAGAATTATPDHTDHTVNTDTPATTSMSATPDTPDAPDAPADAGPAAVAAVAAGTIGTVGSAAEGGDADADHPSGTARVGRARRAGLLPGRMRAKRPDDPDGTLAEPLAAEPPGASVADVPGAGRRRTGLAGLAAADRIAEQEQSADAATAASPASDDAAEPADAPRPRRLRRRDTADTGRPLRSSSNYTPEVTGGHPPAPVTDETAPRERPAVGGSTGLRVGTGVAVAVVALLAFKLGTVTSLILSLLVVTFAAGEAFAVLRRAGWRPATLLGLVGTISLMVGAYNKGIAALPLVMVLIAVFTLLWYLFGVERGSAVAGTASTLLVVGWVALLGSFAGLLLAPSLFPDRHGIAFLLGAIIATVANDVGALVVGRWIGSRQLAPNVSPNKTWEGLAGGALASILVSTVVVGAIHPWSPANAALLGVVVAVVAPLGDLCESLLKRDLKLKDFGTLLPGHGGVLDRVDALIFVLPATYYLVRALNIG